eukprot:11802924-Heterocapsa_arctica.AAC.1
MDSFLCQRLITSRSRQQRRTVIMRDWFRWIDSAVLLPPFPHAATEVDDLPRRGRAVTFV